MAKYDNWMTRAVEKSVSDSAIAPAKFSDQADNMISEPVEVLNGTAVWVVMKKDISRIFYDPQFNQPVLLEPN